MYRNRIIHVLKGPWYGACENAFNTINKELSGTHVYVDVSKELPDIGSFREKSVREIQLRSDSYVRFVEGSGPLDYSAEAAVVISYDIPYEELLRYVSFGSAKVIIWDFGSLSVPEKEEGYQFFSAITGKVPDSKLLYPMIDIGRVSRLSGKPSKPTVGILYDPNVSGFDLSCVKNVVEVLDDTYRVLVTKPSSLYGDDVSELSDFLRSKTYKPSVSVLDFEIGFDWKYQSLCSVCVSSYKEPGHYGYLCATGMSMGKLLICDKLGAYAKYSKDRVGAIHFDDPSEIGKYLKWALDPSHSDGVRKICAAAQYLSFVQDKDPNLYRLKDALSR